MNKIKSAAILIVLLISVKAFPQRMTDATCKLHNVLHVDYETSRKAPKAEQVEQVMEKMYVYLDACTPAVLIDKESGEEIINLKKANENSIIKPVDFRLISYEWGIVYAAMLKAAEVTGDERFAGYTNQRLSFLADLDKTYIEFEKKNPDTKHVMSRVIHPQTLDDAGAMCFSMIKAKQDGCKADLDPMINTFMDHISNKQFRFPDGTLARNVPFPNTLWLDDLYMSVPALAQMGKYSGDTKYYDDAIKQVLQFAERMRNPDNGLYMHGWVQGMDKHPQFHWARANGWVVMTMVELLDVLPEDYPGRNEVLGLMKDFIYALARYQAPNGMWHQLIDRNDSYLETSATAIYTYSIAHAINKGWIDKITYEPMVILGWNALANQVNEGGQVENTCVGTGMGFDPAFYYNRPVHVFAAHGYGPVLLAASEIIELVNSDDK